MQGQQQQLTDNERRLIALIRQLVAKVGEEKAGSMLCQLFATLREGEHGHTR